MSTHEQIWKDIQGLGLVVLTIVLSVMILCVICVRARRRQVQKVKLNQECILWDIVGDFHINLTVSLQMNVAELWVWFSLPNCWYHLFSCTQKSPQKLPKIRVRYRTRYLYYPSTNSRWINQCQISVRANLGASVRKRVEKKVYIYVQFKTGFWNIFVLVEA